MEIVYFIIFLISCFIKDIENVLLKKENINAFRDEKVLFTSEEPSLLQCAQRCKFIDKNSIVDFENAKCTCIKFELDEGQEQQGILTGVFVNKKLVKANKITPPQSSQPTPPKSTKPTSPQTTKPPQTRVINIALDKPAQQSTNYSPESVAKLAVDGSMVTHSATQYKVNSWWYVDLKADYDIMYIVFKGYNKSDTNKGLVVETRQKDEDGWTTCKNIGYVNSSPFEFSCDRQTNARYVKIRSTVACYIDAYEVEVYARVTV